jgi:hypothetical protein
VSDLLSNQFINEKGSGPQLIRQAVAENKPYNEFVYDLITASGGTLENPAGNYYRIARSPAESWRTPARCSRHAVCLRQPATIIRSSAGHRAITSAFGVLRRRGRRGGTTTEEVIYDLRSPQAVIHGGTGQPAPAKFPFIVEDRAERLPHPIGQMAHLAGEPYFAKSLANRY